EKGKIFWRSCCSSPAMPTLIRFAIVLLVLAALAFGAMVALALFVNPGQKESRVRIPPSEVGGQQSMADPLGVRSPVQQPAAPSTQTLPMETVDTAPNE